ncbi:glycoside hydrolase family 3 N-terminal domain-containing protein [Sporolactobacillus spathodeae]|uniref:Beta-glucosidase n=1 Tax=Sporolactobacillus spathodeae TaxID=1465502 RepID=A0ABS2QAN8_9BACL|nr:glycoside hydrolase family 3 N-terminal domain-containing protein [Sporolactobacillus spathodeae]MBM7658400.1 beta-glucosidase [Sporolactobacillus spathodeae]
MNIKNIVNQLTLEEKAALVSGVDFWETNAIPRLDIASIYMTDGPCGLRKQGENRDHLGLNKSEPTTSFPTGATFGSSWNPENMKKMGEAVAKECRFFGVNMILGPAINIKRNPRCGRNFEYLSEDPLISGEMGKAFILAVQKAGIGASVKHFAVNNNEDFRFMGDSVVDERALREIYLKAFEKVVKESHPKTVMSAYNKVNGAFCSENHYLLTDILREEWGFKGAVISDWGGVSDRIASLKAGMDLEMPGDCAYFRKQIIDGIQNGKINESTLNQSVSRILTLIDETKIVGHDLAFDAEEHNRISEEIAVDGAVLLKNEGALPLDRGESFLIVGDLFKKMRYQGAGSSLINPTKLTTPEMAFRSRHIAYEFVQGYRESDATAQEDLEVEVLKKAKNNQTVLFFGGQTDYVESEGYDRPNISLPANQRSLIERLIRAGKKIVFVMYGGSPVELPFEKDLAAILNMYLPGQAGGEATVQLLFGEKTPSGKLAETWVKSYDSVPFGAEYARSKEEYYKESIFVGYRYYDSVSSDKILYPFGYGLSYTTFSYQNPQVTREGPSILVSCDIQNTGNYEGAEIVQIYISNPVSTVYKPAKELRGFQKVYLSKGESKRINIRMPIRDVAYYNVAIGDWVVENGQYIVSIAASSKEVRHKLLLEINDQEEVISPYAPTKLQHYFKPDRLTGVTNEEFDALIDRKQHTVKKNKDVFTMDSKLEDLRSSFIGRFFYSMVVGVGKKQYEKALKMPEGPEKDMLRKNGMFIMKMMPNNSLRSISVSSSGKFAYNLAQGLVDLLNHKYISGAKKMINKIEVPDLPKNQKKE